MKKLGFYWLIVFLYSSCIPYKIAPIIKEEKITKAKKFKKGLPNFYGFIFEDKKKANEFYNYINTKYNLKDVNVASNVSIVINEKNYYVSFFERERTTQTLNLIPFAVDVALENKGKSPVFDDFYTTRSGTWYVILTVADAEIKDCLNPNYPNREEIINHLKKLRDEYFKTSNYIEAYLKMK